jgi:hypothetical protein
MSLTTLIFALAPMLAPKTHTSSVEEKINAAENDALDLAALLIDAKAEFADMKAQRDTALGALSDERDVTIDLRRELHDMTRQRDYAFAETRAARNFAHGLQIEVDRLHATVFAAPQRQTDPQLRAQTEMVVAGDRFQATALFTPVEPLISYPEPSAALLEARAAMQRAQALMNMPVFADVPVHSNGDGPMQVSDPGHTHRISVGEMPSHGGYVLPREAVEWLACTCVPGRSDAFRRG